MARCKLSELSFQACREMLGPDAPLGDLDRQIALMSAKGCSAVEISMACHISTATVSRRRKEIIRRMGV
jgi:DNA-binding NarL/FixJ family response regulator